MNFDTLVMSGGAHKNLMMFGALKILIKEKYFDIAKIKTIYGTSMGSIIGSMLCAGVDINDMISFISEVPWKNLFPINSNNFMNIFQKKGLLYKNSIENFFKPFFKNKKINLDVNFKKFFEKTKKKIVICALNLTTYKTEYFSYETHPKMKVLDAVYMSCSLPYIFEPMIYKNNYYIDGGIVDPFPLKKCLDDGNKIENVFGLRILDNKDRLNIKKDANIFDFSLYLVLKIVADSQEKYNIKESENVILLPYEAESEDELEKVLLDKNFRSILIKRGENTAQMYLSYIKNKVQGFY